MSYVITRWCKSITEDKRDHYVNKDKVTKDMVHRFRLVDDDDVVYAYGVSTSDSSFWPLDEIGEAYGCTSIQYEDRITGRYEYL